MEMKITRDWLHLLTGILALAFGIYCLIIAIGSVAFEWVEFSIQILILCFILGTIYILYGIFSIMTKPGSSSSFMGVGFIIGTYWWSPELPWFMWPLIIMPIVILVLTVLILLRFFFSRKDREWE